jgi:multiple sugar transport system permease protein
VKEENISMQGQAEGTSTQQPKSSGSWLQRSQRSTWWYQLQKKIRPPFQHVTVFIVGLFFLLPFLWMLSTALKSDLDIYRTPQTWLPYDIKEVEVNGEMLPVYEVQIDDTTRELAALEVKKGQGTFIDPVDPETIIEVRMKFAEPILIVKPRWQNFADAIGKAIRPGTGISFFTYIKNSLIIAFFSILGTLISCTTAAYGFSRVHWPGRDKIFLVVLGTMMLPFQVTMIPMYVVFSEIGWTNTFLPLIVPTFFGNAFMIFLLRQFFLTIPEEMCDAARVDGATEWQIFTRLVLPLSKPVLASVMVFTFLWAWNDFIGPLLYLTDPKLFTLAIGLQDYQGQHNVAWNLLMAASVIFTMPIIVAFFFAQRTFIQGVKLTGLKE